MIAFSLGKRACLKRMSSALKIMRTEVVDGAGVSFASLCPLLDEADNDFGLKSYASLFACDGSHYIAIYELLRTMSSSKQLSLVNKAG